ncbi:MAG: hypothetical protein RXO71_00650 [Nitrososphaeria archaeon]|jgi:transcription elongation factor Elf1|nr:hypothetical protein [Nitrososphaerota archaeon]
MTRKKRRVIKPFKKVLPKILRCPRCGAISVIVKKQDDKWVAVCGNCGLRYEKPVTSQEYIDIYNEFVDAFNAGKIG